MKTSIWTSPPCLRAPHLILGSDSGWEGSCDLGGFLLLPALRARSQDSSAHLYIRRGQSLQADIWWLPQSLGYTDAPRVTNPSLCPPAPRLLFIGLATFVSGLAHLVSSICEDVPGDTQPGSGVRTPEDTTPRPLTPPSPQGTWQEGRAAERHHCRPLPVTWRLPLARRPRCRPCWRRTPAG